MEKKLIYFNAQNYNTEISSLEHLRERCQAIIEKFNSLNIGKFGNRDFNKLLFSTGDYLFEKTMTGKPLEVAGMKLSKEKLYDLIEKPTGYSELENLASDLIKMINVRLRTKGEHITIREYLDIFDFADNNGTLKIKQGVLENVRAQNEVYALKENTQKVHDFAVQFSSLLNESDIFFKVRAGMGIARFGEFLDEIIDVDFTTKTVSIKLDAVKSYDYK